MYTYSNANALFIYTLIQLIIIILDYVSCILFGIISQQYLFYYIQITNVFNTENQVY